jgi:hypothetical protein
LAAGPPVTGRLLQFLSTGLGRDFPCGSLNCYEAKLNEHFLHHTNDRQRQPGGRSRFLNEAIRGIQPRFLVTKSAVYFSKLSSLGKSGNLYRRRLDAMLGKYMYAFSAVFGMKPIFLRKDILFIIG